MTGKLTKEDKQELNDLQVQTIENNFKYHKPSSEQALRYVRIQDQGKSMALEIVDKCPPSRERLVALTKIEEAVMWANAAIARNEKGNEE